MLTNTRTEQVPLEAIYSMSREQLEGTRGILISGLLDPKRKEEKMKKKNNDKHPSSDTNRYSRSLFNADQSPHRRDLSTRPQNHMSNPHPQLIPIPIPK